MKYNWSKLHVIKCQLFEIGFKLDCIYIGITYVFSKNCILKSVAKMKTTLLGENKLETSIVHLELYTWPDFDQKSHEKELLEKKTEKSLNQNNSREILFRAKWTWL